MKVLYILHSSGIEGSGNAFLNIINYSGSDVLPIVLLPRDGVIRRILSDKGIKCFIPPHGYYFYLNPRTQSLRDLILYIPRIIRAEFGNWQAKRYLRRLVKAESPDIIHTNTGVIPFGIDIANEFNIPHVWHIREYINESAQSHFYYLKGYRYFLRRLKSRNNNCVAITNAMFDYYGMDRNKDCVIYDGVFSLEQKGYTKCTEEKYLLFVGALMRGKGVLDALEAFNSIHKNIPDYKFYLAGIDVENVSEYISTLECKDKIKLLGFRNDIYQLMANAEALIVPSFYEGFGFISVEAMLNRCLVIGRNTAGIKEQFDNGFKISHHEIGLRFDDIEGLKQQILKAVCMKKEDKEIITDNAYAVVRQMYTCEINSENLLNLYKRILRQKHK